MAMIRTTSKLNNPYKTFKGDLEVNNSDPFSELKIVETNISPIKN